MRCGLGATIGRAGQAERDEERAAHLHGHVDVCRGVEDALDGSVVAAAELLLELEV